MIKAFEPGEIPGFLSLHYLKIQNATLETEQKANGQSLCGSGCFMFFPGGGPDQ